MVTRGQILAVLTFTGAVVTALAATYMLYMESTKLEALKLEQARLKKLLEAKT